MMTEFGNDESGSQLKTLEQKSQEGVRSFFEYLQRNIDRSGLPRVLAAAKTNEKVLDHPGERELYAITALCLQKIWPGFKKWIVENPYTVSTSSATAEQMPVPETDLLLRFPTSPEKTLQILVGGSYEAVGNAAAEWCAKQEANIMLGKVDDDIHMYNRYMQVLGKVRHGENSGPAHHLKQGIGTSQNIIWAILNSLPAAFEKRFERKITMEKFKELHDAVRNFVLYLSTLKVDLIAAIDSELVKGPSRSTASPPIFLGLMLKGEGDKIHLDIEPDCLLQVARQSTMSMVDRAEMERHGCPALYARDEQGKSVVSDIFDWTFGLAEHYCLPYIDSYAEYSASRVRAASFPD